MTPRARLAAAVLAAAAASAGFVAPATGQDPGDGRDCRTVVDYADGAPGQFPEGWRPRDDAARATYRIETEEGRRFVRATAEGTGSQMGREFAWDLRTHPVLSWQWRPREFPAGSDERQSSTNDSAMAVYVVFGNRVTGEAVKYVWSRVVPAGTTIPSGRARVIVLRSGPAPGGGWGTETVDVPRDYRRLFGEAPPTPRGIAVLTDSDQTRSRAVGDYGPFRICRGAG